MIALSWIESDLIRSIHSISEGNYRQDAALLILAGIRVFFNWSCRPWVFLSGHELNPGATLRTLEEKESGCLSDKICHIQIANSNFWGSGETLEQVTQWRCGCPIPVSVPDQVGWHLEEPGLVEAVPIHGRGVGTKSSLKVPSNPYNLIIL